MFLPPPRDKRDKIFQKMKKGLHDAARQENFLREDHATRQIEPSARHFISRMIDACPDKALKQDLKRLMDIEEDRESTVVHGDLGYGNLLYDSDKKNRRDP